MNAVTFATGPVTLADPALFADLYELTMAASYFRECMSAPATFSLFVRKLPARRSYLVAAGLQDVLDYLAALRFSGESLAYLRSLDLFAPDFLDRLRSLRFTGSVHGLDAGLKVLKLSEGKRTWAGQKQDFRSRDDRGRFAGDVIGLVDEKGVRGAEPLLQVVMADGRLIRPHPPLLEVRRHCAAQLAEEFRCLRDPRAYPVRMSERLAPTQAMLEDRVRAIEVSRP